MALCQNMVSCIIAFLISGMLASGVISGTSEGTHEAREGNEQHAVSTNTPELDVFVVANGAITIDDIFYVKPNQAVELTVGYSCDSTFMTRMFAINSNSFTQSTIETNYYKLLKQKNSDHYLFIHLEFKTGAPVGYKLPIHASMEGEAGGFGPNGERFLYQAYRSDHSKSAVVIPQDCIDVVKGSDGKIYIKYNKDKFREFRPDGSLGIELYKLP